MESFRTNEKDARNTKQRVNVDVWWDCVGEVNESDIETNWGLGRVPATVPATPLNK